MKKSHKIHDELNKAKISSRNIKQSKNLIEIDENWKTYLSRLERVWTKSQSHFKKSPKWNGWQGKYLQLRKKDELLVYLINARGADEHTVEEITQKIGSSHELNPTVPNGVTYLRSLRTGPSGEILSLDVGKDVVVSFTPSKLQLLPIVNRGVNYPVPKKHLEKPIDAGNLIAISEAGIAFYEEFIKEAELFFCDEN